MTAHVALQLLISGLSVGCIYALVALALVIPFKASGILNFGQGEMMTLGAYVALSLSMYAKLPYVVVVPLTLVIVSVIGLVIERVFIRPMLRAPEFTIVIGTFAVGMMIKFGIRLWWQDNIYSLDMPIRSGPLLLAGVRINPVFLWMFACTIVLVAGLAWFFGRTRSGKATRAVSQNQDGARLMGIGVERIFSLTWALGAAIAALAAILFAPVTSIHPEIGNLVLKGFVAAIIGGFSSLPGAVVGGLSLGVIETLAGGIVSSAFKNVVAFAILILVLFVRPYGLFGSAEARRV